MELLEGESWGQYIRRCDQLLAIDPTKCFCGRVLEVAKASSGAVSFERRTCAPCGVLIVGAVK